MMISKSKQNVLSLLAKATMGLARLPPATLIEVEECEQHLGRSLPSEIRDFYLTITNGLFFGRLKILPIKSSKNLKKTGDSIVRNNDQKYSIWFNGDITVINEFTVFATEESLRCFCFKNSEPNDSVWMWELNQSEVEELDYTFYQWLEESLLQESDFLRFS